MSALKTALFYIEVAACLLAVPLALAATLRWAALAVAVAVVADVAGRSWSHRSPVPMPYSMRWILLFPRGPQSPRRLCSILKPRGGERILEIGPGVGVHALSIAAALRPRGTLHVLDVQKEMLDALMHRAAHHGISNIAPQLGDAGMLPYRDSTFDAAYLVSVLGEIPDAAGALRELRRVVKPTGRLLIAEMVVDPDFVSAPKLRTMAGAAGFAFEGQFGPRFAYGALFRPALAARAQ